MGQNPTGGLLSVQRRKEIYAICQRFDVLIVEDDPYWYLQYPSANSFSRLSDDDATTRKSSGFPFLDSLVPSYLSVDTDGRVIRLDTFSKTVAPGCRLGWVTAQPKVIERILRITESSTQQPSGFVQAMVAELIVGPQGSEDDGRGGNKDGSGWKADGWVRWLEGLRTQYEKRMNTMCDILEEGRDVLRMGRRGSLSALTLDDEVDSRRESDEWAVIETSRMYDFVR
jgi:DNA-binding transcriptional MocR family regulator